MEVDAAKIARDWLADNHMVAVQRELMNNLAACDNSERPLSDFGITYDARDFYVSKRK
jgi:hypothetical protein